MKKQWWLLLIFGLLLVASVSAQYYRYAPGFTFTGTELGTVLNNILDWFVDNPGWIDALALLVIFLVLGRKALMKHFESKALYVTIAIVLTIGVLLWERQSGFSLILNSGPIGLVIFFIAALMALFMLITHATGVGFLGFAVTYAVFYFYLMYILNFPPGYMPDWFYNMLEWVYYNLGGLLRFILGIAFVGIIGYGLVKLFKWMFGGREQRRGGNGKG